ncbi:signal peptide, CUB and EGF-like domain-containing protein 3 isoform X2 [Drosophila teissieri]|uniref:signal peptide, CUB and EGF-like domain-containing protein 3 isoform X2 n=1 Tax=Drosophila teissieri TaxID=7243 RepID=UPI001CBA13CD|nr:signal peptide, CUB and EGF-like domain-containing protein 3 isoform X2 [Drosophila teissieri]
MAASLIVLYALMCIAFSAASLKDIPEVTPTLENFLLSQYDVTCSSPPTIKHGRASVELRRSGEHVFLVTYYSCKDNYSFKHPEKNTLYCVTGSWFGFKPTCILNRKKQNRSKKKNCRINNGGCAHLCNKHTHTCECYEGYTLNTDLKSCTDIDECKESNGGCAQVCNNLPGEFVCTCTSGFQLDEYNKRNCLDVDECADPELSWDCNAGCENLNGTYKCLPSLVGRVEATDGAGLSTGEIVCKSGFKLSADDSECQDINECDLEDTDPDTGRVTQRYCEHKCENTIGSYICHCPQGYHLLEDRQRCMWDGAKLPPTKTSPTVKKCGSGFELSANGSTCQDIDECKKNLHHCSHICSNKWGGYLCSCPRGWKLINNTTCKETPRVTQPSYDICPLFKEPTNGKASCHKYLENGFHHTRCNITCNAGYVLQGSQFASCGRTGLWSSPEAKCVASLKGIPEETPTLEHFLLSQYDVTCSSPPIIKHGRASVELRRSGEHVYLVTYYSCKDNYSFKNPEKNALYCVTGSWFGFKPTCILNRKKQNRSKKKD